jgi:hypothetical protein
MRPITPYPDPQPSPGHSRQCSVIPDGQDGVLSFAGAAVEPARRLGHLQAPGACGAGQRGRFHRRPGHGRYLLAGLLACGRCGRRLDSAWSNGRPAYRCRHGHTSAASPGSGRAENTYVREDQILPHLAATGILLARGISELGCGNRGPSQVTGPGRGRPDRPAACPRHRPHLSLGQRPDPARR